MPPKNPPKCMPGVFFFGNILQFFKKPRDYFIECSQQHGPVFRVDTPLGYVTIICGRLGKEFLKNETASGLYRKGLFKAFSTEVGVDIFEDADEAHLASRRFVQLPYSRHIAAQFVGEIEQSVLDNVATLNPHSQTELFHFCTQVTLNAVMMIVSPIELRDLTLDFFPYAERVMDIITERYPHFTSKFPFYRRKKQIVQNRINDMIKRHQSGEFKDHPKMYLVDAALASAGNQLDEKTLKAIRGVCIYQLAGSVVYTARVVFFLLFEILKDRQLYQNVLQEIDTAFKGGPIDATLFRRMPILRSAFFEVLRLFPLLPGLPFKTMREVDILDYTLPQDEKIIFVPQSEHFDQNLYPNAYQFKALRFHPDQKDRFKTDAFFPYGLGKRNCAAKGAVEVFVLTIISSLLQKHRWNLVDANQEYVLKLNPLIGPDRPIPAVYKGERQKGEVKTSSLSEAFDFDSPFESGEALKNVPDREPIGYRAGDTIIVEGDEPDAFYILTQGEVEVFEKDKKVATLNSGDSFGEIGLLKQVKRTATVKAKTDVLCLKIVKDEFVKLVVDLDLESKEIAALLMRRFLAVNLKKSIPHLKESQAQQLFKDFEFKNFAADDVIICQGDEALSFFVLLAGSVAVIQTSNNQLEELATLKPGEVFGEIGVVNQSPRNATVKAVTDVSVVEVKRESLVDLLQNSDACKDDIYSLVLNRLNNDLR